MDVANSALGGSVKLKLPSISTNCTWVLHGVIVARIRLDLRFTAATVSITSGVGAPGVARYFEGEKTDFSDVKLDLSEQDAFFKQIYAAARQVGWGQTTTYGSLAKKVGAGPEAARDVGQAMAKNPVALIIPCHRVLAAGGKVGGFSAPGGAVAKIRMLELEGVHVAPARPIQRSFGF